MLDAIQQTLGQDNAPDDVTVYELVDRDGERKLDIHAGPDMRVWDVLGLLAVAQVDARLQAEACWDEEEDE